jgi:acyl carrier protein
MTAELSETALCAVISEALCVAAKTDSLSAQVTMGSAMGSPREWDSLSFVAVFSAVGQAFEVELEDDDAIHFLAVASIYDLLMDIRDA